MSAVENWSFANLATYGNRSGASRNRSREPRNKRESWEEASFAQNAVPQTSIFLFLTALQFGNALTVAMKAPSL
jgi:hypothetical protein